MSPRVSVMKTQLCGRGASAAVDTPTVEGVVSCPCETYPEERVAGLDPAASSLLIRLSPSRASTRVPELDVTAPRRGCGAKRNRAHAVTLISPLLSCEHRGWEITEESFFSPSS